MKSRLLIALLLVALPASVYALDGQPGIHDPATVTECDGKWYTFGTGGGGIMSDDGWTWRGGAQRPGGGVAPDVIKIGNRYLVGYGSGGIHTMWTDSLDPEKANFTDDTMVASGDGSECNPLDPAFLMGPDGRLWLSYGSYVGYIRIMELNPKTGKPVDGTYKDAAINCEASCMMYQDGWYYLLGTKGSCCAGTNSGYNIRVGRSKNPTGPFVDNQGIDMLEGGGKLFATSTGRWIGPGHFGRVDMKDPGEEKWSCHYEADLDRGGASVLDIRPLLWKEGWPEAGMNVTAGTYNIESQRNGSSLEIAVEGEQVGGGRGGRGGGGGRGGRGGGGGRGGPGGAPGAPARGPGAMGPVFSDGMIPVAAPGAAPAGGGAAAGGRGGAGGGRGRGGGGGGGGLGRGGGAPIPTQDVNQVSQNWPKDSIDLRLGNYMCQAQQKWSIEAAPNAGGYPGSPYFKITIAGTNRCLAATADRELVSLPEFTGAPEQCWRIDELTDGTYRIMPKAVPNSKEVVALSAIGGSSATLEKFDPSSDRQKWNLKAP